MALENGEILQVQEMIRKSQDTCLGLKSIESEVKHLQKSIENMEAVDQTIFAKIDTQTSKIDSVKDSINNKLVEKEKADSQRWFTFMITLIVQLIGFGVGLLFIFLKVR